MGVISRAEWVEVASQISASWSGYTEVTGRDALQAGAGAAIVLQASPPPIAWGATLPPVHLDGSRSPALPSRGDGPSLKSSQNARPITPHGALGLGIYDAVIGRAQA